MSPRYYRKGSEQEPAQRCYHVTGTADGQVRCPVCSHVWRLEPGASLRCPACSGNVYRRDDSTDDAAGTASLDLIVVAVLAIPIAVFIGVWLLSESI